MADVLILAAGTAAAPAAYTVPNAQVILPKAVHAVFDGAGASGSFVPVLDILSDAGIAVATCPLGTTIAAGGSAEVSWFPCASLAAAAAAGLAVHETLYLDSTATAVSAASVLAAGTTYTISVQGTFSVWNLALTLGASQPNAMFPPTSTAGRLSTTVGVDAETLFAWPPAHPQVPGHATFFQMDLGGGFGHIEPEGGPFATPAPDFFYTYTVTGQGSAPRFRINDAPLNDNYGLLKIVIYSTPAGGGVVGIAAGDGSIVVGGSASAATLETGTLDVIANTHPPAADWSNNSHKITAVTDPANPQDAATKNYVDTHGGSGTVSSIASSAASITVTNPAGPAVNLDLPTTAVAAGSYGDATHVGQFTVNARGILTAAASVGISGLGSFALIYSNVLAGTAASLDTGANAIPNTYTHLLIFTQLRTGIAGTGGSRSGMRFNGDSGANYNGQLVLATGSAVTTTADATTAINQFLASSAGDPANSFATMYAFVPFYKNALFKHVMMGGYKATGSMRLGANQWASTAAINQVSITDLIGGGTFQIGSSLYIYGIS